MALLDTREVRSEDDLHNDRKAKIEAGFYHFVVSHCEEAPSKVKGTPGISIEFEIICEGISGCKKVEKCGKLESISGGNKTNGMVGLKRSEFFPAVGQDDDGKCLQNLTRLALVTGLMVPGECKEPNWGDAVGCELICEVTPERKKNEAGVWAETGFTRIDWFAFWSLGNSAVKNVPKDANSPGMQALARSGGNSNGAHAGTNTASQSNGNGNAGTTEKRASKYADL